MSFIKPNVNVIWANTGNVLRPLDAKIAQGWIAEIPDFEYENWIQNRQDQFNAHVNQRGVPEWDATTEYLQNKSYVQAADGLIYRSIRDNVGKNPAISPSDWVLAFDSFDSSYSKAEADGRFLFKSNNLSDLTNKATARTELSVYSKTESDAAFQQSSQLSGMVAAFPISVAPTGWLPCNGAAVSRTTYPTLFARIGTAFGAGDGTTTFNLPNLENEFIRGASPSRTVGSIEQGSIESHNHNGNTSTGGFHAHSGSANSGGFHAHSGSTNVSGFHTHVYRDRYYIETGGTGETTSPREGSAATDSDNDVFRYIDTNTNGGGSHSHSLNINGDGSHTHSLSINGDGNHFHSFTTSNTGGSETRPRNIALLYCIKT